MIKVRISIRVMFRIRDVITITDIVRNRIMIKALIRLIKLTFKG